MTQRILVAGIGNIFLADDGFGVEVARRLAACHLPEGVQVVDYGIRGMDLVYALLEDRDALVLVDTVSRGGEPGTVYLIEPRLDQSEVATLDTHDIDLVRVLGLARALGAKPTPTYLVGCEPGMLPGVYDSDISVGLSDPVLAAVDEAVRVVESLLGDLTGVSAGLV